jgi:hypothetical protein
VINFRVHGWLCLCVLSLSLRATFSADPQAFLQKYCFDCHDSETKKGGLNLEALKFDLETNFNQWVKIVDRVGNGEMPPKKKARPEAKDLRGFTNSVSASLMAFDSAKVAKEGRATKRRLNRYEYEETLRDLLSLRGDS